MIFIKNKVSKKLSLFFYIFVLSSSNYLVASKGSVTRTATKAAGVAIGKNPLSSQPVYAETGPNESFIPTHNSQNQALYQRPVKIKYQATKFNKPSELKDQSFTKNPYSLIDVDATIKKLADQTSQHNKQAAKTYTPTSATIKDLFTQRKDLSAFKSTKSPEFDKELTIEKTESKSSGKTFKNKKIELQDLQFIDIPEPVAKMQQTQQDTLEAQVKRKNRQDKKENQSKEQDLDVSTLFEESVQKEQKSFRQPKEIEFSPEKINLEKLTPNIVEQFNLSPSQKAFKSLESIKASEQQKKEPFDIEQQYMQATSKIISEKIENWIKDYQEATSNMYVQENLKDDILTIISVKNDRGELQLINGPADMITIEKLQQKYKNNPDVQGVLQTITSKINKDIKAQQVTPLQANTMISKSYNPAMVQKLSSILKIQPTFDQLGKPTNIPSVETIIEMATENPTAQTYQALQTVLQATQVAIYRSRNHNALMNELKSFEQQIQKTLENQHFKKFDSFTSQLQSAAYQTAKDAVLATGIGDVKVSTALNTAASAATYLEPHIDTILAKTGIADMTMSQLAEKTGFIQKAKEFKPTKVDPNEPLSKFDKIIARDKAVQKAQADEIVTQYYTAADVLAILPTKPILDPTTNSISNMPSIDTIIQSAWDNPTLQNYKALESALEATKVAAFASQNTNSIVGKSNLSAQLMEYQQQLTQAMQDPRFMPFKSLTTRLASFLPSTKAILEATGIGAIKVSDIKNTASSMAHNSSIQTGAQYIFNQTGIPNMTLSQVITTYT